MMLPLSLVYTLLSCLNLLFIYLAWLLLCFLYVWIHTFHQLWKHFSQVLFKYCVSFIQFFLLELWLDIYIFSVAEPLFIFNLLAFYISFWVISLDLSSSWQVLSLVKPNLHLIATSYFKFQWLYFSILRNFFFPSSLTDYIYWFFYIVHVLDTVFLLHIKHNYFIFHAW